ncbi:hypothetical protein D081_1168 [Anaerovibrio sp. JC8]|uniref:hypothetical protein n=1 Tax=Anaerovibrio sp. JC8 TaxID=1240085 RepID=UPI000A0BC875|nr:hypothetical protein [Anaerovibrio sp. JC8]ORU00074.1 hypothetical protein D081_1168 [Anaerovibrio sp. JC8]
MYIIKKIFPVMAAILMLSATSYAMPNPMVMCPSILSCEKQAGFSALTMPPGVMCRLDECYVISDNIIDLRYTDSKGRKFNLRTAPLDPGSPDISGVYTDKWYEETVEGIEMHFAFIDTKSGAVYWNDGKFSYSITGKEVRQDDFKKFVSTMYKSVRR